MISMDGFRDDYLTRGITPNIMKLGASASCYTMHRRILYPTSSFRCYCRCFPFVVCLFVVVALVVVLYLVCFLFFWRGREGWVPEWD